MRVVRPEFAPDPSLSREEMEALQRDLAAAARFEDEFEFDPAAVGRADATLGDDGVGAPPAVAAVDQAFLDERAVSAVVVVRGGDVVERAHAVTDLRTPYIPGLLSFREGEAALAALESLSVDPDLLLVDGSGRIHFRQAGIATHLGVMLDVPCLGVAKGLLCGRPRESLDDPLPEGTRVAIEADGSVDAPDGTLVGYAVQTRQYEGGNRYVNPVYVSPGHRVGPDTAADLVLALRGGYKLPEPIRLADAYADEVKGTVDEETG